MSARSSRPGVGVELAALPVFLLALGLEDFGLTVRDVRTASMDQTAMEEACRRGDLDAVVTDPPTSVRLARELETTRLFSSADAPREGLTPEEFSAALSGGIVLVGADEQAPYVRPDGALERTIRVAGRLLVAAGQLRAAPAPGSLVEPLFIGESRP